MGKFTTGLFMGGVAAILGTSYVMQDRKAYRKMVKKGKHMALHAEEVMDDLLEDMTKN
ncbi:MAG: hypothetical protein R3Y53_04385 [Bacillota bacterium]